VKKYPVPTKEQCEELLNSDGSVCTMSQAYGRLKKPNVTTLQMYVENGVEKRFSHVHGDWYNAPKFEWIDIPVVEEIVDV
jgi:hypothetical protein